MLSLAGAASCGRVQFVPSPYTPLGIDFTYAPGEDLTVVRWHIEATAQLDSIRFELAQSDGSFAPMDFGGAPYPSGTFVCPNGTCAQLVLRGHYDTPVGIASPVRAVHAEYGLYPGTPPLTHTVDPSIGVRASFPEGNPDIALGVEDRLIGGSLPRRFAFTVWPSDTDPCDGAAARATFGPLQRTDQHVPVPGALTAQGRYCVAVRGIPQDHGRAQPSSAVALTFPVTTRGERQYKPPADAAPVLTQFIVDLATADGGPIPPLPGSRCEADHGALLGTLRQAVGSIVPAACGSQVCAHEFELIDLAPGCQPSPGRLFSAAATAQAIKEWIHQNLTTPQNRVLLFYANNQGLPLPDGLAGELSALTGDLSAPDEPRVAVFSWSMLSPDVSNGPRPHFDLESVWTAIEDQGFARLLRGGILSTLPFETEHHDNNQPVALLDATELGAGGLLKACQDSPAVSFSLGTMKTDMMPLPIGTDAPPGFFVDFPSEITIPQGKFHPNQAFVRYEICHRYCDHPFIDDAGAPQPAWKESHECVHNRSN